MLRNSFISTNWIYQLLLWIRSHGSNGQFMGYPVFSKAGTMACSFWLFILPVSYGADFTLTDLNALSRDEQIVAIRAALESRMQLVNNVEVSSTTTVRMYQYDEGSGELGTPVNDGAHYRFNLKRLGESYLIDAKLTEGLVKQEERIASLSNYDEDIGESRILGQHAGIEKKMARIDEVRDDTLILNPAAYYLLGGDGREPKRFVDSLLAESSHWTIGLIANAESMVVISFPFQDPAFLKDGFTGSRSVAFNWDKGMVPVRESIEWRSSHGGKDVWFSASTVLSELELIGDVWWPRKIRTLTRGTALGDGKCVEKLTELGPPRIGTIKKDDLQIVFPAGTFVTDAVRGHSYTVGENGAPKEAPQPFHVPAELNNVSGDAPTRSGVWIWLNLIGIAAIVTLIVAKRRRSRSKA